jgi:hypothetical protein
MSFQKNYLEHDTQIFEKKLQKINKIKTTKV